MNIVVIKSTRQQFMYMYCLSCVKKGVSSELAYCFQ